MSCVTSESFRSSHCCAPASFVFHSLARYISDNEDLMYEIAKVIRLFSLRTLLSLLLLRSLSLWLMARECGLYSRYTFIQIVFEMLLQVAV